MYCVIGIFTLDRYNHPTQAVRMWLSPEINGIVIPHMLQGAFEAPNFFQELVWEFVFGILEMSSRGLTSVFTPTSDHFFRYLFLCRHRYLGSFNGISYLYFSFAHGGMHRLRHILYTLRTKLLSVPTIRMRRRYMISVDSPCFNKYIFKTRTCIDTLY